MANAMRIMNGLLILCQDNQGRDIERNVWCAGNNIYCDGLHPQDMAEDKRNSMQNLGWKYNQGLGYWRAPS